MAVIALLLVWAAAVVGWTLWTAANLARQLLPRDSKEPPVVFHWFPFLGSTIEYGKDPYLFMSRCRAKYGDIFTFVLLGKNITCYLGIDGNEFILNGKQQDLNAEEIYGPLTTPVFGSDVVYDCPNSKLMEQKKFIKFGLTRGAFEQYVPKIEREVAEYYTSSQAFQEGSGTVDITKAMSQVTIFTAARTLQGDEVRQKLTAEFASLYHDLDMGFQPVNFILPWAPLPHNRKRDAAHARMREIYIDIIRKRRNEGSDVESSDMIWNLMNCTYKNGTPVPDKEIAHMMITLLMAGQHTSASTSSWIILHLASKPDITEELYQEQCRNLASQGHTKLPPLQYGDLDKLPLLRAVIKETLRVHSSIVSVMRKVKRPMAVPGTPYIVSTDKTLMASPLVTALDEEHFSEAEDWDPRRWMAAAEKLDQEVEIDFDDMASFAKGVRNPYLPFGAGRHRCIGEQFAYVNLSAIVATLVREFRFYNLDGRKGVPRTDYTSLFSKPAEPAMVRWERRSKLQ